MQELLSPYPLGKLQTESILLKDNEKFKTFLQKEIHCKFVNTRLVMVQAKDSLAASKAVSLIHPAKLNISFVAF